MWHSSAWVCGRNAASLPVISSLETASPAIYFLWDGIGFRGGNAPPTTHIHTHLFKFLCFKLAQWAYTSLLIIFHLKHWEGVEAEHACSFIGAAVGCVRACVCEMETMQLQIHSLMNVKQPLSELLQLYTFRAWWIYQMVNEAKRRGVALPLLTLTLTVPLRDKTNRKQRAIEGRLWILKWGMLKCMFTSQ